MLGEQCSLNSCTLKLDQVICWQNPKDASVPKQHVDLETKAPVKATSMLPYDWTGQDKAAAPPK